MCVMFMCKCVSATATFFGIFVLHCVANSTSPDIERLFTDRILATNHRIRPQLNQSEATCVNLSIVKFSLMDVNEVQQSVASNVLLVVTWLDETRRWDPNEYGGISKVHPEPTDIWKPRFFLSNSIGDRDMFEDDYGPLTIFNDGLTVWKPGGMLYTFCFMKMTHFPFDTQTCSLSLTTGEATDTLFLHSASSNIGYKGDKSGEWLIEKSITRTVTVNNIYHVKFIYTLKRLYSFTLINMVIPVNIISSISSLTFLIPVDSGERVSFSITVLLSLTVYTGEISKDLPTNSESLPLLIMYLACLLLHSGFVIVANLAALKRHFRSYRIATRMEDITPQGLFFTKKLSDTNLKDNLSGEQETPFTYTENTSTVLRKHTFDCMNNVTLNRRYHNAHSMSHFTKNTLASNSCERRNRKCPFEENESENMAESKCRQSFSYLTMSCVFSYISVLDFILFLFSFILWLLITTVFMTLMVFDFL